MTRTPRSKALPTLFVATVLLLFAFAASGATPAATPAHETMRIAVLDLQPRGVSPDSSAMVSTILRTERNRCQRRGRMESLRVIGRHRFPPGKPP